MTITNLHAPKRGPQATNTMGPTVFVGVVVFIALFPATSRGNFIYVANQGSGTVGLYTTSGVAVDANLITGLVGVWDVAVSDGFLYVSTFGQFIGSIGKYDLMGEPINPSLITGLTQPSTIAISGTDLYVNNAGTNRVGKYTTSGATVNASFITTTAGSADAVAVSGSLVYVAIGGSYRIATYSTATGAVVNNSLISSGVTQVRDIAISGSDLYVSVNADAVRKFTTSGATVDASLITDLDNPYGVAVLDSDLYVSTFFPNSVIGKYTTSGDAINPSLISTGLNRPYGIAVVSSIPEPSSFVLLAIGGIALLVRWRIVARTGCKRL